MVEDDQARALSRKREPRSVAEVPLSEGRRRDVRPLCVPSEVPSAPISAGEPDKANAEEKQASRLRHPLYEHEDARIETWRCTGSGTPATYRVTDKPRGDPEAGPKRGRETSIGGIECGTRVSVRVIRIGKGNKQGRAWNVQKCRIRTELVVRGATRVPVEIDENSRGRQ